MCKERGGFGEDDGITEEECGCGDVVVFIGVRGHERLRPTESMVGLSGG